MLKFTTAIRTIKNLLQKIGAIAFLTSIGLLSVTQQAMSHHGFGGETPDNFIEAFLSGLAHPIIGLDHLSFVIASGLIAAEQVTGIFIPLAFVLAAMVGTVIHLLGADLPAIEIAISTSVVVFGVLVAVKNSQNNLSKFYGIGAIALGAVAGIFHGYAYAEAIIGAEMTPTLAYLAGFTVIQLLIAWGSLAVGIVFLKQFGAKEYSAMRFLGLVIGAIGIVFLTASIF